MPLKPKEIAIGRERTAVPPRDTGSTASGPEPVQKEQLSRGGPRDLWSMTRPLLILRIFLGFTFSYARLQKPTKPNFFEASAPGSVTEQLRGSVITSPLRHLLILLGFNGTTGAVVLGPAATGLAPINIKLEANGDVIVEN